MIHIHHWHNKLPNAPYQHGEILPYSTRRRNTIISNILKAGYAIQILPTDINEETEMTIYIAERNFKQR